MSESIQNVSCRRCGKTLSNPASVQLGYGPICARKLGIVSFAGKSSDGISYIDDCICPDCGGLIERVIHKNSGGRSWTWTCGGVSGDGCHSDFGSRTLAPIRSTLEPFDKDDPQRKAKYMNERWFHREVANRTFERLGIRAVPPYPGVPFSSESSEIQEQVMEIVREVWTERHAQGYYGRFCQFFNPSVAHCDQCGTPRQKIELQEHGGICKRCSDERTNEHSREEAKT